MHTRNHTPNNPQNKPTQKVCLLEQRFVLDDAASVGETLRRASLRAAAFARVQVGEGLEAGAPGAKDFAAEVAEMAAGGGAAAR